MDNAIDDIKRDFQVLLKNNQGILENAYTERIEQVKSQISTIQQNREQEMSLGASNGVPRVSIENLQQELKQVEKTRDEIDNEYRPLIDQYIIKQKEKTNIDEERMRLDTEYSRLMNEINQITEAIELGKQYGFSVRFELETYRRLLDLQTMNSNLTTNHGLANGKEEHQHQHQIKEEKISPVTMTTKKTESQRAISKTGKTEETCDKR